MRDFLAPLEGTSYYAGAWFDRTDTERFHGYLDLVELFVPLAGAIVLDAGMGTGGLLVAARQRGAGRLLGVEVDPATYDLAATRLGGMAGDLALTDGGVLPWQDATVDVAFSLHVIEHVRDPEGYLREIARVLKCGGVILVACPNRVVPREVHGDIPYVTWLPVSAARQLCAWRARRCGGGTALARQYDTATRVDHFVSYRSLRRWWRGAGLEPQSVNPAWRCDVLASDLRAWGAAHPVLAVPFRLTNNWLLHALLAPAVRRQQVGRLARWLSIQITWEHMVVLRKR